MAILVAVASIAFEGPPFCLFPPKEITQFRLAMVKGAGRYS